MERSSVVTNFRTQLVVVNLGVSASAERSKVWSDPAEEFLRRIHKLGIELAVIGSKPNQKFGTKRTIKFLDRHEIVTLKELEASKSHSLELRVLNRRNRTWIRVRAEACLVLGNNAVWPEFFEGWNSPGVVTADSMARWMYEFKWMPGRDILFCGSTNQNLRMATAALERGASSVYILEPSQELRCWRAHRDRFLSRGGRILLNHKIVRYETNTSGIRQIYVRNEKGTMILPIDTVVFAPVNVEALGNPEQMRSGLFYIQRRQNIHEPYTDEEQWLERLDWRELYWRVGKSLDALDHNEAEGALKALKEERRRLLRYRKPSHRGELHYSGKILSRESAEMLQNNSGVPRKVVREKPVASLECLENIPCRACADACPENAISILDLPDQPMLQEDKCTGCGICVAVCPAGAAVMVRESAEEQKARFFLPDYTRELWKPQTPLQLLNRKGDVLTLARVVASQSYANAPHRVLELEASNVHVWEGRAFKTQSISEVDRSVFSQPPQQLKRGWVTLNGTKRLCPTGVPLTVALWQLGQKRFEDAFFCEDGSCRMCKVRVNGVDRLSCQTIVTEGQSIEFASAYAGETWACPCSKVHSEDLKQLKLDDLPEKLIAELTGFSFGSCKGKWCSNTCASFEDDQKPRPVFHGYQKSPWRDYWVDDVIEVGDG